jgi:protein-L-isoaspartate(D-aspartate) O-methyltransferase
MSDDAQSDGFAAARNSMVELQLKARGIRDPRVLSAMQSVPRHEFVAPEYYDIAYADHPIPIGEGQTVSQPYIVAAMVEALAIRPENSVLEVGTGTGYQAAILGEMAARVFTIERHASLAEQARSTLAQLGYRNVTVVVGDGSEGYAEAAPFDAIIVAAAAPQVPPPLWEQLNEGGRMIIPVGGPQIQELQLLRKIDGQAQISPMEGCRFVPLIGTEGFSSGW